MLLRCVPLRSTGSPSGAAIAFGAIPSATSETTSRSRAASARLRPPRAEDRPRVRRGHRCPRAGRHDRPVDVELGHSLGPPVVAEGVEHEQTLRWLGDHGCDVVQGYHLARPLPAEDFLDWLITRGAANGTPVATAAGRRIPPACGSM